MENQKRALTPEEIGMTAGGKVQAVPHLGRYGVIDDETGIPLATYKDRHVAEIVDDYYKQYKALVGGNTVLDGQDYVCDLHCVSPKNQKVKFSLATNIEKLRKMRIILL